MPNNNENQKPIFPLVPGGKVPARNAVGYSDPANYENLRGMCLPGGNYGLLMGKHTGLFCLDFDLYKCSPEDRKGFTLEAFKKQFGEDVYVVKTPRGGFHVVFEYEARMDGWSQVTGIDGYVDTRTTGGYIVGAGSKTVDGVYERLNGDILKPTKMPDEWKEIVEAKSKIGRKRDFSGDEFAGDEEIEKALEDLGFHGIDWVTEYSFKADENGKTCPCCGHVHDKNCWRVSQAEDTGSIFVKSFSDRCSSTLLVRGTEDKLPPFAFILDENEDDRETPSSEAEPKPKIQSYKDTKEEMEKRLCRVDDVLVYPYVDDGGNAQLYTKTQLKEVLSHLKFVRKTEDENGNEKSVRFPFVKRWLDDSEKRAYRTMGVYPKNCPRDVYNRWVDFKMAKQDIGGEAGDVQPFTDLLWELCGAEQKSYDYMLKWLAYLVQYPEEKPQTAIGIKGKYGIGKNLLFDFIGKEVMGDTHYFETSNPLEDIFGTYATQHEGKKLIFVDEMEVSVQRKMNERMKALITNKSLTINPKGIKAYSVNHLAGYIFAGNGFLVSVPEGDRRFVLFEATEKYISTSRKGQEFVRNFLRWKNDPRNAKAVYNLLMNTETNIEYLKHERPVTKYYKKVRRQSLPIMIKWLDYLVWEEFPQSFCRKYDVSKKKWTFMEEPDKEIKVSTEDLMFNFLKTFNSEKIRTNLKDFGIELRKLVEHRKLPFTHSRMAKGRRAWIFTRRQVFDWLVENDYTEHVLNEEGEDYGGMPRPVDDSFSYGTC
jgi:hypothetical protein